jgi:hypothetical protein
MKYHLFGSRSWLRVVFLAALGLALFASATWLLHRQPLQLPARSRISAAFFANPERIRSRIDSLDLEGAQDLLQQFRPESIEATRLRARLALYRADCDEARAILGPDSNLTGSARELSTVAEACARSMSAASVVTDRARSLWLRLQDDADAVWAPLVMDTAAQARAFVAGKLGVSPDTPLRIELVMDHASLSALTGLPIEAAETTGTVAVARFGRVTLLSPRSFKQGYPWQDTLAHEITHLLVTAATSDNAPLWLQEALAKHLENAWRAPRPHDGVPDQHEIARTAWLQGKSVGFERLGASIALLPNPEAAGIAYAEVYDFLDVVIRECGWNAIRLLLREIRDLGGERTDSALQSVTGYSIQEWTRRWRHKFFEHERAVQAPREEMATAQYLDTSRRLRLAELFDSVSRYDAVEEVTSGVIERTRVTELRNLAGHARLHRGSAPEALGVLGEASALNSMQGEWLALRGRALAELGRVAEAKVHWNWALAYSPSEERVACEGYLPSRGEAANNPGSALCSAATTSARSASEPLAE